MSEKKQNLFPLDELPDYKVASDYSDIRGWEVIDAQKRVVGKVQHLLVNKIAERVVYIDVEVDQSLIEDGYNTYQEKVSEGIHGFINEDGDDHLIIPVGMVSLDTENEKVFTNQINYNTFTHALRFKKGSIVDREYELMLLKHYSGDNSVDISILDDQLYRRKEFENYIQRKKV